MSAVKKFLSCWLPLAVWMVFIFGLSGDSKSVGHTSYILEPILKFFWPDISAETISIVRFYVRKAAHATEYAILAWLWWRALSPSSGKNPQPWHWKIAGCALLLAALYAATDEFHQSFVPGREASVKDVLLDTGGAAGGLWFRWLLGRWRKNW